MTVVVALLLVQVSSASASRRHRCRNNLECTTDLGHYWLKRCTEADHSNRLPDAASLLRSAYIKAREICEKVVVLRRHMVSIPLRYFTDISYFSE